MMIIEAVLNVLNVLFEVPSSLVHTRPQTLAKVLNSLCDWLLRKFVPDVLQCGSKFRNRSWLFL